MRRNDRNRHGMKDRVGGEFCKGLFAPVAVHASISGPWST